MRIVTSILTNLPHINIMKYRILKSFSILIPLFIAAPVHAQLLHLQDISVSLHDPDQRVAFTLKGLLPSPCLKVVPTPVIEDSTVTIQVELAFPEGVTECIKELTPFTSTSAITTPPPGEYEVVVSVYGEIQVVYNYFNVENSVVNGVDDKEKPEQPIDQTLSAVSG